MRPGNRTLNVVDDEPVTWRKLLGFVAERAGAPPPQDNGPVVFPSQRVSNQRAKAALECFENYMLEGPLAALGAIESATGERSVNAIGYCLGGTLLASTAAYSAAKGDARIASAPYFVTLVDFTVLGD